LTPKSTSNTNPNPKIIVLKVPEAGHKFDPEYPKDIVDRITHFGIVVRSRGIEVIHKEVLF
jgi:hypothetical protein